MLISALLAGADSSVRAAHRSLTLTVTLLVHQLVFFRHSLGQFKKSCSATEYILGFVLYFPGEKKLLGHLEARSFLNPLRVQASAAAPAELYLLAVEVLHAPVLSGPFLINEKKLREKGQNRQELQHLRWT